MKENGHPTMMAPEVIIGKFMFNGPLPAAHETANAVPD